MNYRFLLTAWLAPKESNINKYCNKQQIELLKDGMVQFLVSSKFSGINMLKSFKQSSSVL
jgi:hypothetical protein